MRKTLPYILFSLIIPVSLAVLFYHSFRSDTTDIDPSMHYLTRPSAEQNDIIFIGNSHTVYLIDPRIVDSVTGHPAYNLGLEGVSMVYYNMVYRTYMRYHPAPKYLLINIDHSCFNNDHRVFNFPDYIPYLRDSMVAACLVPHAPEYQSSLFRFYYKMKRINSKPDPNKMANLYSLFTRTDASVLPVVDPMRGFQPMDLKWENQKHDTKEFIPVYSPEAVPMLRDLIQDAQSHHVKVILICTPLYKDYRHIIRCWDAVIDTARSVASAAQVPFWDYSDIPLTDSLVYYYNVEHLNASGAAIYSRMLAADIRAYLADSTYIPDIEDLRRR